MSSTPGVPPDQQQPQPDEQAVEQMVRQRQEARRQREEDDGSDEPRSTADVIKLAAKDSSKLSEEEVHDALEAFMAQDGDPDAAVDIEPKPLKLNVGSTKKPKHVRWVIAPLDDDVIKEIRKSATQGNRSQRRRGDAEIDENKVARRIVARATVEPDLRGLAKTLGIKTDPGDVVLAYFRKFKKTGLIVQISGEVLSISGYDEDDVSELDSALG